MQTTRIGAKKLGYDQGEPFLALCLLVVIACAIWYAIG